ncbi:DNA-3-methyladenine glycosylase [Bacteroidales bacterium OttesenSCG-928-B11]|nr:DNA-3-methyladenine glycosylase [Bacteroidales bacterium OttesenSCG-928-E04]MDL2312853.1 DNA-3-methyladenine glycosylase [Bacteroidales bacterium OttesenSCG-928-B11]MDL2325855.1 DNA-3-methyladenine glycosylase [Bacteroidales bacterium OttesenSCG-928-A14]
MVINSDYFLCEDVVFLAKDLIGKYLFTKKEGQISGGIICETEAYNGVVDRASHAYGGRRTQRTETMYAEAGTVYVYLCYGMHHLFNIVTNRKDIPHAILIRAIFPTHGEELMLKRTGKRQSSPQLTDGPGKLSKALGITVKDDGILMPSTEIWLENRGLIIDPTQIEVTPRIGVDYAGEDAKLPYRMRLEMQGAGIPGLQG